MASLPAALLQRRAEASKDLPESAAASTADLSGAASDLIKSYTNKLSSVKTSGVLRQAIMMGLATRESPVPQTVLIRILANHCSYAFPAVIALLLYFLMRSRVRSNVS